VENFPIGTSLDVAFEGLAPESLWQQFDAIRRIPRASTNEEGVRSYLRALADAQGWERDEDGAGNIVLRVPGRGAGEHSPALAIQGHMDMVCVKDDDRDHDFTSDPIEVSRSTVMVSGESHMVVRAVGTSLGSDNAIGCCAGLALGLTPGLEHPPLELLFTADEETGMTGAANLDPALVRSRRLLNLDAEEHGSLYVSCAGGRDLVAEWDLPEIQLGEEWELVAFELFNLRGGHSGVDIDKGRANAAVESLRLLRDVAGELDGFAMRSIESGGLSNAIPRFFRAEFWVLREDLVRCENYIRDFAEALMIRVSVTDPATEWEFQRVSSEERDRAGVSPEASVAIVRALANIQDGVFAWSVVVDGLVETSSNLGVVRGDSQHLRVELLSRSSVDEEVLRLQNRMSSAFEHTGATVTFHGAYPGWVADPSNPLLRTAKQTYEAVFGEAAKVKAIHAGLECGILGERLDGVDMLSFGPEIWNAHTTDEMVFVSSVSAFWSLLKALARNLC